MGSTRLQTALNRVAGGLVPGDRSFVRKIFEFLDVRLELIRAISRSLIVQAGFLRVELGPDLLQEVRESLPS